MCLQYPVVISVLLIALYMIVFAVFDLPKKDNSEVSGDNWKIEYESLDNSARQRETSLLLTGAIFVTASLLLMGESTRSEGFREVVIFTSWGIYSIWLFLFQLTTVRLGTLTYARLRRIEESKNIKAHSYLNPHRDPARRWVWFALFSMQLIAGNALIGSDLTIFFWILPIELAAVVVYSLLESRKRKSLTLNK